MRSRTPLRFLLKAGSRTPELIPFFTRAHLRKHWLVDGDINRGDGISSKPPLQISLRITNACNHRCAVCAQYGEEGYMLQGKGKHLFKTLSPERYFELVDEVSSWKPLFYITGGEAFLYRGMMDVCGKIKASGCPLSVVTNGVKLADCAEEIVKQGWEMVLVSFDGPEAVHDQCRGVPGAYRTAVEGIQELCRRRDAARKAKPYIMTSTTISKINAPVLEETFEIGQELRPDVMVVYLSWFTTEEIGRAHTEILEREIGITPFSWKGYLNSFNEIDRDILVDAIRRVQNRKWGFEYLIIPSLGIDQISDYYLKPSEMFGYSRCAAPYFMVDIMPNGDVVTCRDFIDVKVGNIEENKLMEIWNNEAYQAFRQLLHRHGGLLPICARCCGLMGF